MQGIIVKSTGSWYTVMDEEGNLHACRLKGQFRIQGIRTTNPVAVGDHVQFQPDEKGSAVIIGIEPRRNYIIRKSINLSKASHIIAANIDRLYIVASVVMPRTSSGFIDRLLVTAEAYHVPAAIVFNKIDIYDSEAKARCDEMIKTYTEVGYPVFATSAVTGNGIDELRDAMKDKVNLFAGHSGVGKSALINTLDNKLNIRTGDISSYHSKGTHTTTFAEMHPLSFGGFIIDSPGIKEFGLVHFESREVAERFPEFRALMDECRYNNCTHVHEPGCAVKTALEKGDINAGRYRNYLAILNDENLDNFDD